MKDSIDFGFTIAELRKQAGLSQKQLADSLNITDKAVSKWERGLACPDISLLPKLSSLLDTDIEPLLKGVSTIFSTEWYGVLVIPEDSLPLDTIIFDKPMVYYLLSTFLLVGINHICVVCSNNQKEEIENILEKKCIGFSIEYYKNESDLPKEYNILLQKGCTFIFAASLTRQLHSFMCVSDTAVQVLSSDNAEIPVLFIPKGVNFDVLITRKKLNRGTFCIPLNSYEAINDVSNFVKIYQNYHNHKIADLEEIAKNRNLI